MALQTTFTIVFRCAMIYRLNYWPTFLPKTKNSDREIIYFFFVAIAPLSVSLDPPLKYKFFFRNKF